MQNCSPVTFLFGGISSEKKHETRLSTPPFNRLPRNLMLFENLAFEFNSASVTMARQSEFLKFRILKRDTICFKLQKCVFKRVFLSCKIFRFESKPLKKCLHSKEPSQIESCPSLSKLEISSAMYTI